MNGTAQMRILFAKAWLAKSMKLPDKAEKYLTIIIEVAKPDDLSPMLLAMVGDSARKKGDLEKANGCYVRLRDVYKTSEFSVILAKSHRMTLIWRFYLSVIRP